MGNKKLEPGPGAFDVNRDVMWQGNLANVHGMAGFNPGAKRIEWGTEEDRRKPGPGAYDSKYDQVVPDKLTSAPSAFVSADKRRSYNHSCAPGPSYYTVALPKATKSFRM